MNFAFGNSFLTEGIAWTRRSNPLTLSSLPTDKTSGESETPYSLRINEASTSGQNSLVSTPGGTTQNLGAYASPTTFVARFMKSSEFTNMPSANIQTNFLDTLPTIEKPRFELFLISSAPCHVTITGVCINL